MSDQTDADSLFYVNGVNASTGSLIEEPLTAAEIAARARQPESQPDKTENALLKDRNARTTETVFRPIIGVDEREISETGWGVVLASDADPKILDALRPLLDFRKRQAGALYKEYTGGAGYLKGDTWDVFRTRSTHHVSTGQANPAEMPYYVLLVGDPTAIPYRFQYHMDVERGVGRIHFASLDDYRQYAESVVQAAEGKVSLPRRLSFFATANPDDIATRLSSTDLADPLCQKMTAELASRGWTSNLVGPQQASKDGLGRLLGGADAPALLFTATHGAGFNMDDPRMARHQGALITKEYPGPVTWRKGLTDSFYFSADDLSPSAQVWGMIAVFFACFGAGAPPQSDFFHLRDRLPSERLALAPQPFLAQLPTSLLSHPNGGALAVIGHVERAWTASFRTPGVVGDRARDLLAFEQMLSLLARGFPVGAALEDMNTRCAQHAVGLSQALFPVLHQGLTPTPEDEAEISNLWTSTQDARNYIIIGDPAVSLPLAAEDAPAQRAAIVLQQTPAQPQPAQPQEEPKMTAGNGSDKTPAPPKTVEDDLVNFLPLPEVDAKLMELDPKLYEYWREHVHSGFKQNDEMFKRILDAFLGPYYTTVWMYRILFAIGALSFAAAVVMSLVTRELVFSLIFGGLSVFSFLAFFVRAPLRSLEENLEFITWLGFIYNTYWARTAYAMNRETIQQDLHTATQDSISALQVLIAEHAKMSGKRYEDVK